MSALAQFAVYALVQFAVSALVQFEFAAYALVQLAVSVCSPRDTLGSSGALPPAPMSDAVPATQCSNSSCMTVTSVSRKQ